MITRRSFICAVVAALASIRAFLWRKPPAKWQPTPPIMLRPTIPYDVVRRDQDRASVPSQIMTYTHTVNRHPWRGHPARTVQCVAVTQTPRTGDLHDVHYRLEYSRDGWDAIIATLDPATGEIDPSLPFETILLFRAEDFGCIA